MAYEQTTGTLGPERDDLLTALVAMLIHNTAFGIKRKDMKKAGDFLPDWDRGKKQTPEEMLHTLRMLNAMAGGTEDKEE